MSQTKVKGTLVSKQSGMPLFPKHSVLQYQPWSLKAFFKVFVLYSQHNLGNGHP